MRNFERVKEDIRAGRTELVWEEKTSFFSAEDPYCDKQDYDLFSIYKEDKSFSTGRSYESTLGKFLVRRGFLPIEWDWCKIAPTIEETKIKLQEIYNNFLLDQAKKLDEKL